MADVKNFLARYSGPGCLAGITLPALLKLLAQAGFRVSPKYFGKAAYIGVSSLVTSVVKPAEWLLESKIAKGPIAPPIFIVGSWRSGTTHLHNLLNLDQRFLSPNLYQTMYPHTFLTTQSWLLPLLGLFVPQKRFMDNMKMGLREPAEDEMALAIMSQRSNMLSWTLGKNKGVYDRFLDFKDATVADKHKWKRSFQRFARKVACRSEQNLLLKSPNHTARIQLLLEMYPEAKFIHIRRNPVAVYRSMSHMATQVIPVWALQTYPMEQIPQMVIRMYRQLYHAWFQQCSLIPNGHLSEISYEELIESPLDTLDRVYSELSLNEFETLRPRLKEYLESQASYRRNTHQPVSAEIAAQLRTEWCRMFETWNYPLPGEKNESIT